jgi:hypothetical protein
MLANQPFLKPEPACNQFSLYLPLENCLFNVDMGNLI